MIVWGHGELIAPFISEEAGISPGIGNCQTAAVLSSDGRFMAGVAFHNWNPQAGVMEVSAAAVDQRWASRSNLRELFGYVFSFCTVAMARTGPENHRVRRLWQAFGAEEHIIPHLRGRGASEAVQILTDEAWANSKFMRLSDGQA